MPTSTTSRRSGGEQRRASARQGALPAPRSRAGRSVDIVDARPLRAARRGVVLETPAAPRARTAQPVRDRASRSRDAPISSRERGARNDTCSSCRQIGSRRCKRHPGLPSRERARRRPQSRDRPAGRRPVERRGRGGREQHQGDARDPASVRAAAVRRRPRPALPHADRRGRQSERRGGRRDRDRGRWTKKVVDGIARPASR